MKTHEAELLAKAAEEEFEERAAIMEYDGGLSRTDAERNARMIVFGDSERGHAPIRETHGVSP